MYEALHARRNRAWRLWPGRPRHGSAPTTRFHDVRRLLAPLNLGVGATRHLIWYLSYQITGETRDVARTPPDGLTSRAGRT
jgi:hypothetical protein